MATPDSRNEMLDLIHKLRRDALRALLLEGARGPMIAEPEAVYAARLRQRVESNGPGQRDIPHRLDPNH